jgi:hypothetical protein
MIGEEDDPAAIERSLQETRARLDEHLGELEEKLSPAQIANDALAYLRTDGASFTADLAERMRDNPLPTLLVGVGIVWLMAGRRPAGEAEQRRIEERRAAWSARADHQKRNGKMTGFRKSDIKDLATNPLALGAAAAVAGLVAGALIPTLDSERQALGTAARKTRRAGADLAQDLVDRGGEALKEAIAATKDIAEDHGLTADRPVGELVSDIRSGQIVEDVKQVALESVDAAKSSAQAHLG